MKRGRATGCSPDFHGLEEAGAIPVMLPLTAEPEHILQLAQAFDGFLFPGGHDVSPSVYGEEALPVCGPCCPQRDAMERLLMDAVLRLDKPVFGICRGIQIINALLGGTLYQDLPAQHPSDTGHRQAPPYDKPSHRLELVPGSPLHALLDTSEISVNSCHHQAVKDLAPPLKAMAFSPDGLVEAVWMPEKSFVWAVQWHPEFSHKVSGDSKKLFRAFADAAVR